MQGKGRVFLLAATLRPETMYGQTNCWALPDGDYGAFRGPAGEVYIMTARSALNLSWQDRMPVEGRPELLLPLKGQDLIGVPLKASLSAPVQQPPTACLTITCMQAACMTENAVWKWLWECNCQHNVTHFPEEIEPIMESRLQYDCVWRVLMS